MKFYSKFLLLSAAYVALLISPASAEEVRVPYDADDPINISVNFRHGDADKNRAKHKLITQSDSERYFRVNASANFEQECRDACPEGCQYVGFEGGHVCEDEEGVEHPLDTTVQKRGGFSDLYQATTSGPLCGECIYECPDELANLRNP